MNKSDICNLFEYIEIRYNINKILFILLTYQNKEWLLALIKLSN